MFNFKYFSQLHEVVRTINTQTIRRILRNLFHLLPFRTPLLCKQAHSVGHRIFIFYFQIILLPLPLSFRESQFLSESPRSAVRFGMRYFIDFIKSWYRDVSNQTKVVTGQTKFFNKRGTQSLLGQMKGKEMAKHGQKLQHPL